MTELPKIKKIVEVPVETWGDLVEYATRDCSFSIRVGDIVTRNEIIEEHSFPRGVVGVVSNRYGDLVSVMWPYRGEIKTTSVYIYLLRSYKMPLDEPLFD